MSLGVVASTMTALSEFAADAGIAAGVFNSLRQVGSALGVAIPAAAFDLAVANGATDLMPADRSRGSGGRVERLAGGARGRAPAAVAGAASGRRSRSRTTSRDSANTTTRLRNAACDPGMSRSRRSRPRGRRRPRG